jgi:hypothetical protein
MLIRSALADKKYIAEILQNLFGINNTTFSISDAFIDGVAEIAA